MPTRILGQQYKAVRELRCSGERRSVSRPGTAAGREPAHATV
ncbi:hypothetical protein [Streptomyces sp. JV178]|nr:hypothetical protein [Streptomyces sp. JV178]